LDSIILQDLTRDRSNDRCAKVGQRHGKVSRRNKYNDYRNGRDNLESKQKQSDNKYYKYPWNIRRLMKSNSKQYGK